MRFVAARHEGGAATMADAYARMSGTVGVLSVHQGPGLTNAMTGITEAAKSRTPLLVLAAEALEPRSNFHIDQSALAAAVGAVPARVESAATAVADTARAFRLAADRRTTVLLNLPLGLQNARVDDVETPAGNGVTVPRHGAGERGARPSPEAAAELAKVLAGARRPVFVAGRGARRARRELERLAERTGALLATSAVARGLFVGNLWSLDVSGGFASPLAAELIRDSDVVVGWGCGLNMWTTRHGALIGPSATVVQVDLDHDALGAHRPVALGVAGDVAATARAAAEALGHHPRSESPASRARGETPGSGPGGGAVDSRGGGEGWRTPALAERIAREVAWRDVPYTDGSGGGRIDPRTLSIALDDLLPAGRLVSVDSGNFMGYPSMYLSVPDENAFCFTQAFQSVGLGLATAVGAALARPDLLAVAALGDGGALMGVAEMETVVRLGLPMMVVVYDDEAYGAEVHHFGPQGHALDRVRFPPCDIAAVARGYGWDTVTVREPAGLAGVSRWLDGPRDRPLLVHAKITADRGRGGWRRPSAVTDPVPDGSPTAQAGRRPGAAVPPAPQVTRA